MHDRMPFAAAQAGTGAFRRVPSGPWNLAPPRSHRNGILDELLESARGHVRPENEGPAEAFGFSPVSGGADELREQVVGDGVLLDRERIQGHFTYGPLAVLGKALGVIGAHEEAAAGQIDQTRAHL